MNINIIASSCNELNNEYVFSLLKTRDKNKNHIIITPDRSQFSIEQRIFEETGEKCFFDISIMSFSRLCKLNLKNTHKNILTKQSGVALVKKILIDNQDKLCTFKRATNFMGFASSLFETICFYKSCNVSPDDIFVSDSDSLSNLKQKDIKLVYSEYEKYLQSEYTDSFNQLKVFADSINSETFKDTVFYILEFDDFTRLMYEIMLKMARYSDAIYISCVYGRENNNSNIFNNKVYYDLIDLFKSDNLEYKINKINGFVNKTKDHLLHNVLSYMPKKIGLKDYNISLRSFDNMSDEIKHAIGDIYTKLLHHKSLNLSDFAIVVPSISEYKMEMEKVLNKYDMSYYIDESEKLKDNYLIRLIFEICILLKGEYRLHDFSVVMKSPLLNFDTDVVYEYDNYLRRVGAIGDMCLRESNIDNIDICSFIKFIKDIRVKSKDVNNFSDCLDVISDIYLYITSRIDNYLSKLTPLERRVFDQVTNKYDAINKDIVGVFGNVKITDFAEFLEIYHEYFVSTTITLPPITSNTLLIADFGNSYVSNYEYIYILGNNDGKLPSQKLDNGLITDDELLSMPNAKRLTPTIAMLNARKTLKLFEMLFRYKGELVLSYVNGNAEGKLYPNKIVKSIVDIGGIEVSNYSGELDTILNSFFDVNDDNVLFNNLTPKMAGENLIDYLNNWQVYNNSTSYREICSTIYSSVHESVKSLISNINQKNILPQLDNHFFFLTGSTSISQIETYYRCPYVHFVRYGLRLKDNKDTILKPNDIGNIIHETLSVVVPFILKHSKDIDLIQEKARFVLNDLLSKEEYKEIVENQNNTYIIKSLYREMDRVVVAITNEIACSNFEPKFYEYYFDNILNIDGVGIKGFIDRIDTNDKGFIVIDYKTGDNQFKNYNDVYSGKKLQLLVYAKAFENKTALESKGVFYLPISNHFGEGNTYKFSGVMLKDEDNIVDMDTGLINAGYKSKNINLQTTSTGKISSNSFYKNMCLTRKDFDYLLNFAIKQVEIAIANIKKGEINPYPLTEKNKCVCDYCEYKALCNYNDDNPHDVINVESVNKLKELEDGRVSTEFTTA